MAATCTTKTIIISAIAAAVVITGIVLAATVNIWKPYHTCSCSNGEGHKGRFSDMCAVPGDIELSADYCSNCNEGYSLYDVSNNTHVAQNLCQESSCQCENGVGTTSTECPATGDFKCKTCNDGFHMTEDFECVSNQCDCTNGSGSTGINCPTDGTEKCGSCDRGYVNRIYFPNSPNYAPGPDCEEKRCGCYNGYGPVNSACYEDRGRDCIRCSVGYHLTSSGLSVREDQDVNDELPRIETNICDSNVCTCANGVSYGIDSTFDPCLTHGSGNDGMEVEPKCASCNDGYVLNGDATACDYNNM